MCGRFSLTDPARLTERYSRYALANPGLPRYNVAPQQDVLGVCNDNTTQIRAMRWGLVPPWARDQRTGMATINARVETVAEKPMYRRAFRSRRCLVFADGFYEWQATPAGKQPDALHPQNG